MVMPLPPKNSTFVEVKANSGSDFRDVIQSYFGERDIKVPKGTYGPITSDIIIPNGQNGGKILGRGRYATHVDFSGAGIVLGNASNAALQDVEIANMTLDGGGGGSVQCIRSNMPAGNYRLSKLWIHDLEVTSVTTGETFAAGKACIKLQNLETSVLERLFLHGSKRACLELTQIGYFSGNIKLRDLSLDVESATGIDLAILTTGATANEMHRIEVDGLHVDSDTSHIVVGLDGHDATIKSLQLNNVRCEDANAILFDVLDHTNNPKFVNVTKSQYIMANCNPSSGVGTTTGIDLFQDDLGWDGTNRLDYQSGDYGVAWAGYGLPIGGDWENRRVLVWNTNGNLYRLYTYVNAGWHYVTLT